MRPKWVFTTNQQRPVQQLVQADHWNLSGWQLWDQLRAHYMATSIGNDASLNEINECRTEIKYENVCM